MTIIAVTRAFTSMVLAFLFGIAVGASASADELPPGFVSLDKLPGRTHIMPLQAPTHFYPLRSRAAASSIGKVAVAPAPASMKLQFKPSHPAAPLQEDAARQLLSIFPEAN